MSLANTPDPLSRIHLLVDAFDRSAEQGRSDAPYFLEPDREAFARALGSRFWLPLPRAYAIFCYAYSALFGIPAFTQEALSRQSDRFSRKRLPLTIRTTSGFILDAFGYNPRNNRARVPIYLPGPVIRSVHGQSEGKQRISNAAMAYFGHHLIRAAECLSETPLDVGFDNQRRDHYDYVGDFFRSANYPFPPDMIQGEAFSTRVDQELAGDACCDCWNNVPLAAEELGTPLDLSHLAEFLPERSRAHFRQTVL
jgi:hypothetical protein